MRRLAVLGTCGLVLVATACARAPEPPPRTVVAGNGLEPRPDWSTALPELLPGIRACLADPGAGGRAVGVTKAWPIGQRLTGVRVLQEGGARVDCVAAQGGERVFLTEPVLAASRLPGEHDPLFTPGSKARPTSPCLESSSAAEGWLSYDVCRDPRPIGPAADHRAPSRAPSPAQDG
jgi:hypothetical protein